MLVVAPLLYLGIAYLQEMEGIAPGYAVDLTVYLLLAVGILEPSVYWLIERSQIAHYRESGGRSKMSPSQVYFTLSVIRMAFVEAIYVFGLTVYFVTGSYQAMLYFYPVALAWTVVHWPRRAGYERLMHMLGAP